ncbi:hypothetical protein [Nocardioides sediminis]|uniref:hypothetical protein n=1 Tax=Nocardioides sediminis TaxID=433648 RepID=UPI000D30358B|nr:hypothetical protein [Nocardioides sediminis]
MVQETSEPGTTGSDLDERPAEQEPAADLPRALSSAHGVPLRRLLPVVVLTPAQACLVAVQLLDATHPGGTTNGTNPADDRWSVAITPSGDVEVARATAGEGTPVTELLGELAENARRLPAHPTSEQVLLLRRLEQAAADPRPDLGVSARELEGALAAALGTGARQRVSGQLAALVGAFAHVAASVAVPADARATPAVSRPGPRRAAPAHPGPSRPPRRGRITGHRRSRTRRLLVVGVLLTAAIAASGYVVLRDPDSGPTSSSGATDRDGRRAEPAAPAGSSGEPAARQRRDPRPDVTALAGRSAGPITAVEVAGAAACTPGTPCPVTVTVRFRPAETTRPVAWRVGAARSCESPVTWSGPVTVTAQPGWTSVYNSSSVPVPEGRSPVLVALTTAPARAQSPPVPVAGSSLRC